MSDALEFYTDEDIRSVMRELLTKAADENSPRRFARANKISLERFSGEAAFRDDVGLDSLSSVEFVMSLEDRFDIELDDAAIDSARTVDELVALIQLAMVGRRAYLKSHKAS